MSNRNNLVEFERFLYSLLVVGYHIQAAYAGDRTFFFKNGATAVEFFFVVSGYFFARSIEKINSNENRNILRDTFNFMKSKIKTILPAHIISNLMMIIFSMIIDIKSCGKTILNGLPGIFLVQMAAVWTDSMELSLNVPEWYISTMLLSMLIMLPISLLIRRKISGFFVNLILILIIIVIISITGLCTKFNLPRTLICDARGWAEICLGMLSYHLSIVISKKDDLNNFCSMILKIIEIFAYNVPIVLGFLPINENYMPLVMSITAVFTCFALSITFAKKGVVINNAIINNIFGYLGIISLPIYLFHWMTLGTMYGSKNAPMWKVFLIIFSEVLIISFAYQLIYDGIKKLIEKIKRKKQTDENVDSKNDIFTKLVE